MTLGNAVTLNGSRTWILAGAWLGLFALTSMVCGLDYHLSPSGDDANDGLRPETAWRTLDKANTHTFQPGDQLLLEGGARSEGNLELGEQDGGDPNKPVVITSFGEGRAAIDGGDTHAIQVVNTRGLVVRNLQLVGSGRNSSQRGVGLLLNPGIKAGAGSACTGLKVAWSNSMNRNATGRTSSIAGITVR
jgi:hypothetical protein